MTFDLKSYLKEKQRLIDTELRERWLPPKNAEPKKLNEAMHYSLFATGKRIRPILTLAVANTIDIPEEDVLPIAASLEMIHAFSLIHDDLPAMDDDDMRRGQPTNHKVFGEALAILAGDNLLATAFIPLTELNTTRYDAKNILTLIQEFAHATGSRGMIAGQVIDLAAEGCDISLEKLKVLHHHKTGALIRLATEAPAILAGVSTPVRQRLAKYGTAIGLAFQIADDILDIEGGKDLGKNTGSDVKKKKATYPALLGLSDAKEELATTLKEALTAIEDLGKNAEPLRHIARFIVERRY